MPSRRRFLLAASSSPLLALAAPVDVSGAWKARWIAPPGAPSDGYGVYHFRRTFSVDAAPAKCVVYVSADPRYRLFCNGAPVGTGPARGDLFHWRYEAIDLAPHLRAGKNVLAAVVWNDGPFAALSQWSWRTAFVMQAAEPEHEFLNTGAGRDRDVWIVSPNPAYTAVPVPTYQPTGYYAIGAMERVDGVTYPWGWETADHDDSHWKPAQSYLAASARDGRDAPMRWMLVPRPIPMMEESPARLKSVRKAEGATVPAGFIQGGAPFTVPANSKATVLLDNGVLTCAYPHLRVRGGKNAMVTVRYTEGLIGQMKPRRIKGNRDEVEGKEFLGYADSYIADGSPRTWSPLYWRTYRYIRLEIETSGEPLTVEDFSATYTGYPFAVKAKFDTDNASYTKILEVGWRTARLCAHETYMDCPYYEQLQYAGDTRIQCMVSLFMTGDSRLMRNAIEQLNSSRTPEGATFSRAPSTLQQYIPPFSLWWIGMVRDYWWYVPDADFVKEMLLGVRSVLAFYHSYQREDGSLRAMPWWNYVDWVEKWPNGTPPCERGDMPATIHLQLLLALQWGAELEDALGDRPMAVILRERAAQLAKTVHGLYWDSSKKLYSEDRSHKEFSQHANVLAVLAGLVPAAEKKPLMLRVESDKSLYPCSVYFRWYLDQAMDAAGMGDRYLSRLGTWDAMLAEGLTTWKEQDSPYSRSDCHAWGSTPNIEFFRTVLGVDSAAPGYAVVRVKPQLGPLTKVSGQVPHPKGVVRVSAEMKNGKLDLSVEAPAGVKVLR